MIHIYSKVDPKKLLHTINKIEDIDGRHDITPEDQFLQVATIKVGPEKEYRAHQHIWKDSPTEKIIAQESWVVIKGSINAHLFDIDGSLLVIQKITPGDCTITFEGGHKIEVLEENTILYEYKTGPYTGQKMDKIFY